MGRVLVVSTLLGLLAGSVAAFKPAWLPVDRDNVWSIAMCTVPSPLDLDDCVVDLEPAWTADDVTGLEAQFVADPFTATDSSGTYLFFELLNRETGHGDIGVAAISDDVEWRFLGLALDEAFHVSYPHVFQVDGVWYMTPETEAADRVALYEATDFPLEWRLKKTLVDGIDLADPTVFQSNGRWWMFVGRAGRHDQLRLFHSETLEGDWEEHPESPLVVADPGIARPAGRVIDLDGRLFRLAQNSKGRYGQQVVAFEIVELSPTAYEERQHTEAVLSAGQSGWNSAGMHHLDARPTDDGWLVAVDGHRKVVSFRLPWRP